AWSPGKIADSARAAPKHHHVDPVKRLERAQENAGPDARGLAGDIAHIGGSIDEIDIGMTAFEIERAIPPCGPTKGVAGGIARRISLGLDDSPAGPAVRMLAHENLADEVARKRNRRERQLCAAQAAERLPGCQDRC